MLDAQMCQHSTDLGRLAAIHPAAGFGCVEAVTAAIQVRLRSAAGHVAFEHLQQRPERRRRAFFFDQGNAE